MKVSFGAGHVLLPFPLAVNRATDLCPALPETFLSIQVVFLSPWFRRFWSEETITESDHDHKSHGLWTPGEEISFTENPLPFPNF